MKAIRRLQCLKRKNKRSGSSLNEMNGHELHSFLLEKARIMTWDAVPLPDLRVTDLDQNALAAFRKKAVAKGRMSKEDASVSDHVLMQDLKLYDRNHLMRAAALMFHPDPEQYVGGAYI